MDEQVAEQPLPIGRAEWAATAAMLAMFVAAQGLAVLLTPSFEQAGIQGFEDPNDWTNGIVLIGIILVFTAVILWIARKNREKVIQWIILGSVGLTVGYVFFALFFDLGLRLVPQLFQSGSAASALWVVALALAVVPTWLLYTFPEWYVVDMVGILVAAGAVSIFGTSFTPATYMVVLVGTAIYDAISVYKTKHMLDLADSVLELHLPIMLVVPKSHGYSFLEERGGIRKATDEAEKTGERKGREAMFLGLGDIVLPSILIVSALTFTGATSALGAFLGILVGFIVLMTFVLRGRPQAGLPALNGGALLGFVFGFWFDHGHVAFWT